MKTTLTLLVVVILLIGGFFIWRNSQKATPTPSSTTETTTSSATSPTASAATVTPTAAAATKTQTISATASGFSPQSVTIASGTTVTFKNNGSASVWPASNPHPIHNGLPGFDAKAGIKPGETYSFTFTKTGTFGFHDHLNPSVGGTIIVQ